MSRRFRPVRVVLLEPLQGLAEELQRRLGGLLVALLVHAVESSQRIVHVSKHV